MGLVAGMRGVVAVKRGVDLERPLLNEWSITGQRKRKNGDKNK